MSGCTTTRPETLGVAGRGLERICPSPKGRACTRRVMRARQKVSPLPGLRPTVRMRSLAAGLDCVDLLLCWYCRRPPSPSFLGRLKARPDCGRAQDDALRATFRACCDEPPVAIRRPAANCPRRFVPCGSRPPHSCVAATNLPILDSRTSGIESQLTDTPPQSLPALHHSGGSGVRAGSRFLRVRYRPSAQPFANRLHGRRLLFPWRPQKPSHAGSP